jgi:hypothetical protein
MGSRSCGKESGVASPVEIQLQVSIDPKNQGIIQDAISFETGLTRSQAAGADLYAYEHHGAEFTAVDPGALTSFFEDVVLGRPLPLKFAASFIRLDTLFAITLFLHRDLATHPSLPAVVAEVDLVHRRGLAMYGHVDSDRSKFFRLLGALFPSTLTKAEEGERLRIAVEWIYEYVKNGALPHLGPDFPAPGIVEVGSNGFVFATTPSADTHAAWVELYRLGFLRGVLVGPEERGRRQVLASRKSVFVEFNLYRAADILNEMEHAMGEPAEWALDELWLRGPSEGTILLVSQMMAVFLRI